MAISGFGKGGLWLRTADVELDYAETIKKQRWGI
jgi:hypothetical protein